MRSRTGTYTSQQGQSRYACRKEQRDSPEHEALWGKAKTGTMTVSDGMRTSGDASVHEDSPEEPHTLRGHLVIEVQSLEQVGGRDCATWLAMVSGASDNGGRTVGGPEALRRLDEDVLEETGETVTDQLRANEREDGNSRVLKKTVSD